jgi:hypothetical protein
VPQKPVQRAFETLFAHDAQALNGEIRDARRALKVILRDGPLRVMPETLAQIDRMSDVELIKLKYQMREFLRAVARAAPVG